MIVIQFYYFLMLILSWKSIISYNCCLNLLKTQIYSCFFIVFISNNWVLCVIFVSAYNILYFRQMHYACFKQKYYHNKLIVTQFFCLISLQIIKSLKDIFLSLGMFTPKTNTFLDFFQNFIFVWKCANSVIYLVYCTLSYKWLSLKWN